MKKLIGIIVIVVVIAALIILIIINHNRRLAPEKPGTVTATGTIEITEMSSCQ